MNSGLPPDDEGAQNLNNDALWREEPLLEEDACQEPQRTQNLNNDALWREIYLLLQSWTRRLVHSSTVSNWRGQEDDVAEDLVQETAYRLWEYMQKVKRGEAEAIHSLEGLLVVVAQNRCRDSIRRDRRMVRLTLDEFYSAMRKAHTDNSVPLDVAIENVEREKRFKVLARLIALFPEKQRVALLIDLANRMHFGAEVTPLQQAFLDVGIQLQDYQRPLPTDPVERSRHSSLLHHAYKRVALLYNDDDDE